MVQFSHPSMTTGKTNSLAAELKFSLIRIIPTLQDYCETGLFSLLTQVHRVKAMVFPVVMYGCENWTIKKAEHQVTDASELW